MNRLSEWLASKDETPDYDEFVAQCNKDTQDQRKVVKRRLCNACGVRNVRSFDKGYQEGKCNKCFTH